MSKSSLRAGVYPPPGPMLPYVGVVITPQGKQILEAFWNEAGAQAFVEKHTKNYVEQLSVVGRGIRKQAPGSED